MAFTSQIPIHIAKDRGNQHWKVKLSNWGNAGTNADATSLIYDVPLPIVGAQIAAESDVSEAVIRFAPPRQIATLPGLPYRLLENDLYIRRGQPYFWRTPATIQITTTPQTVWSDEYYPTGDPSATANFGCLLAPGVFQPPELDLILFFDHSPLIVAEADQPREPAWLGQQVITDANPHLLYFALIQHRNRVRINVENPSDTDPIEYRVTGIRGWETAGPPPHQLREFNMFSTPIVLQPLRRESLTIRHPEAIWLGVYAQKQFHTADETIFAFIYAD